METHETVSTVLALLWRVSWQASVLVLLVLAAQWVFGKQLTGRWRHALWLLVVCRLALPVSFESTVSIFNLVPRKAAGLERQAEVPATVEPSFFRNSMQAGDVLEIGPVLAVEERSSVAEEFGAAMAPDFEGVQGLRPPQIPATAPQSTSPKGLILNALFALWLTGVLLLAGRTFLGSRLFAARLCHARLVTDPEITRLFEDCRERLGVRRGVQLCETGEVEAPALFGLFRLRLLLPREMAREFSLAELRHIFLHELAHVRRGDATLNWIITVLQMVHWFNPLVWFAFHRMKADRELACDELALSHTADEETREYGRTIIKLLERFRVPAAAPGLVGIMEDKQDMQTRIRSIALFRKPSHWSALAVILVGALGLVTLTDARVAVPEPDLNLAMHETEGAGEPEERSELVYDSWLVIRLVDAETGRPINGGSVGVECWNRWVHSELGEFRTGADGTCEILYPAAGLDLIILNVERPGYVADAAAWNLRIRPRVPDEHTIELVPGWVIGGIVRNEAGKAVEDVEVSVYGGTVPQVEESRHYYTYHRGITTRTDVLGRWTIDTLPPRSANFIVSLRHPQYAPTTYRTSGSGRLRPRVEMDDLLREDAVMEIRSSHTIAGVVVDSEGRPMAGAEVVIAGSPGPLVVRQGTIESSFSEQFRHVSVLADDEGRFEFSDIDDLRRFSGIAAADRSRFWFSSISLWDFDSELVLRETGKVEGVLRVGNRPGAGERVELFTTPELRHPYQRRDALRDRIHHLQVEADADGRFIIEGIPPGKWLLARMIPRGHRYMFYRAVTIPVQIEAGKVTEVTIGGDGRDVIGRAVFEGGPQDRSRFVGELRRRFPEGQEEWIYTLFFDAEGRFETEDVPPGVYEIRIELRDESSLPARTLGMLTREIRVVETPDGDSPEDLGVLIVPAGRN